MGIDVPSLQLLCCAKSLGVDFSDTMTVGRQRLIVPSPEATSSILRNVGIPREAAAAVLPGKFAESLFTLLGATQVSSVDASDYEGATHIHDFNQPLPGNLASRFSVVHDGGSIEHVFNIPQAFKNCMEMVRVGGHFIQVNEANNYMGHGFWQFCPELIYRILSRENGFEVKTVLLHEHVMEGSGAAFGTWYKVQDPAVYGGRVELTNGKRTYICTISQRVEGGTVFARFPQQSAYVETWKKPRELGHAISLTPHARFSIRRVIPGPFKRVVRWALNSFQRTSDPFDRPCFRRISDDDVMHGRV